MGAHALLPLAAAHAFERCCLRFVRGRSSVQSAARQRFQSEGGSSITSRERLLAHRRSLQEWPPHIRPAARGDPGIVSPRFGGTSGRCRGAGLFHGAPPVDIDPLARESRLLLLFARTQHRNLRT